ncbi:MAG TPA: PrsW family glutamic-type intramembrane protease [Candidatus Paceibacterota bacterium]|nr:PrsW family glutamic-type intramembrane protease [Candidatus Paceibacterota bacterium]
MTLLVVALVCGLLPGFAWLVFYLGESDHAEPKRLIVFTFVAGMAFGFFTVAIENIFSNWATSIGIANLSILSLLGLAAIEEVMKFGAAHFALTRNPDFVEPVDAMIYMVVAALGFATLENIGAIAGLTPQVAFLPTVFETLSMRFVGATLLHTLTSGIVGYYWAVGLVRGKVWRYLAIGLPVAAVLHAFFNYLILTYGGAVYSVIFLLVVGFFVLNDFEMIKARHINLIT